MEEESKTQETLRTRCQPKYFVENVGRVLGEATEAHRKAVNATPFASYLRLRKIPISAGRLDSYLKRPADQCSTFIFGRNIRVPFRVEEFSIFMGLRAKGQFVNRSHKHRGPIPFMTRCFPKVKNNRIFRPEILEAFEALARKRDPTSVRDFSRMYVLMVFSCILFPTSNFVFPTFLLPYVDRLDELDVYAWGHAVFMFLVNSLNKTPVFVEGCTLGLFIWVWEHVPSLGQAVEMKAIPRFTRGTDSRSRPSEPVETEKLYQVTRRDLPFPIALYHEELKYLKAVNVDVVEDELFETDFQSPHMGPGVDQKMKDAMKKGRKQKIKVAYKETSSIGQTSSSAHVDVDDSCLVEVPVHAEQPFQSNDDEREDLVSNVRNVVQKEFQEGIVDSDWEDTEDEEGHDKKWKNSEGGQKIDFVAPDMDDVYYNDNEVTQSDSANTERDEDEVDMVDQSLPANEVQNMIDQKVNEKEEDIAGQNTTPVVLISSQTVLPVSNMSHTETDEVLFRDLQVLSGAAEEEKEAMETDDMIDGMVDAIVQSLSEKGSGQTEQINSAIANAFARRIRKLNPGDDLAVSSIVRSVWKRSDRVPKKDPHFVTPPGTTTTPPKKIKKRGKRPPTKYEPIKAKIIEVLSDDERVKKMKEDDRPVRTLIKSFPGIETLFVPFQKIVELWVDVSKCSLHLVDVVLGDPIVSDVIDVYFLYLSTPEYKKRFNPNTKVLYLGSMVATNIERLMTVQKLDDAGSIIDQFSDPTVSELAKVTRHVMRTSQYIVMPIHIGFHWYLIAFDVQNNEFIYYNSMPAADYKRIATECAKVFHCYLLRHNFTDGEYKFTTKSCRKQGTGSMDCGPWACMFGEMLLRNDPTFSAKVNKTGRIVDFRAHLVSGLLSFAKNSGQVLWL